MASSARSIDGKMCRWLTSATQEAAAQTSSLNSFAWSLFNELRNCCVFGTMAEIAVAWGCEVCGVRLRVSVTRDNWWSVIVWSKVPMSACLYSRRNLILCIVRMACAALAYPKKMNAIYSVVEHWNCGNLQHEIEIEIEIEIQRWDESHWSERT